MLPVPSPFRLPFTVRLFPLLLLSSSFCLLSFLDVIYADAHLVCKRAKNHYDPRFGSDTASSAADGSQGLRDRFRPLHENQAGNMYFMVSVVDLRGSGGRLSDLVGF